MTTKANTQRAKRKTKAVGHVAAGAEMPTMQADDVYVPSSLRKTMTPDEIHVHNEARWERETRQVARAFGIKPESATLANDGVDELCGEPFSPIAIYFISAAVAFAGGLGIGWAVWA